MRVADGKPIVRPVVASLAAMVLAACQAATSITPGPTAPQATAAGPSSTSPASGPQTTAPASIAPTERPGGVYWATLAGQPAPSNVPARVYVPDEHAAEVIVVDPATFRITGRLKVGSYPEHVSPSWDGQALYVDNMLSDSLSVIDPSSGTVVGSIAVQSPYNLYFTPDGTRAIVVEDMTEGAPANDNGLRFYTYPGFEEVGFVPIPWAGADHLDFSADGRTLFLSCEYSGRVVVVDVATMAAKLDIAVGGYPTDVRLAPDGRHLFVANQLLDGLTVIDPDTGVITDFIQLERGTHGLAISRDTTKLFVTNRLAGSISVIDFATLAVERTVSIGASPDMIAVSPDGSQLWISNRYDDSVVVVDSTTLRVTHTIAMGAEPHGLAYWPVPGRYSLGHNGNMR